MLAIEDLKLANLMASASGTLERPGTNEAAKQARNHAPAEAALGRIRHWICVYAEEAGRRVWVVPARNTSSRRYAACGHGAKEPGLVQLRLGQRADMPTVRASTPPGTALPRQRLRTHVVPGRKTPIVLPEPRLRRREDDSIEAPALAA